MKRIIIGVVLLGLSVTLFGCTTTEDILEDTLELQNEIIETEIIEDEIVEEEIIDSPVESIESTDDYGSLGALEKIEFTIEEMLIYALEDEYAARGEYIYIMDKFNVDKPFSNIKESEETHIALLLPLFEIYGIIVIEDTSSDHLYEIDSLQEAYEIGIIAEINNIAMYNLFLEQENLPQDLIDAFTELRDASINHQEAFEKNANK